jgi:purine-nucleoside/S-methyl-5'-thioadenosine phosphorylase / adenosine deaminase
MTATAIGWIEPEWPVPAHVRVISTLRGGGVSQGPYASLNLAAHVGDDPRAVAANRMLLREAAHLPAEPLWLEQVHGTGVVSNTGAGVERPPCADAAVARETERVCAVMTADCLPVAFTDRRGTRIALAHAGWRGLAAGVLEATISALELPSSELHAWLGPAIGADSFEVGGDVREIFLGRFADAGSYFRENARGRWQADLSGLARLALDAAGVTSVHGGSWCTCEDAERFYSFRRDGVTGRMATLAWLA